MSYPAYSPDLILCNFWLTNSIERSLTDWINKTWLAHVVSKVPKNFFEKDFKKTFNKLLERIKPGITNNGNYPQHLIK